MCLALFIDFDLSLHLTFTKFNGILYFVCAIFCVKYLKPVTITDTGRDRNKNGTASLKLNNLKKVKQGQL